MAVNQVINFVNLIGPIIATEGVTFFLLSEISL